MKNLLASSFCSQFLIVLLLTSCILDEDNSAPNIEDQTFSIAETSESGALVGTIMAMDDDGDELIFTILSGNTNSVFVLDPVSGELTVSVAGELSVATLPSYSLNVQVTDGTDTSNATITINVTEQGGGGEQPTPTSESFESAEEVREGLVEGYAHFRNFVEYHYLFDAVYANTISAPSGDWDAVHGHTLTSTNDKVLKLWEEAYDLIFLANNIYNSAQDLLSGDDLNEVQGQALVMRAYAYHIIFIWFENAPVEEEFPESEPEFVTRGEILDLAIAYLDQAETLLPASWTGEDVGNFSQDLAKALKTRIYQLQLSIQSGSYANVMATAGSLISGANYTLSNSSDNFTASDSEIIGGFDISSGTSFESVFPKGDYVPISRYSETLLLNAEAMVNTGSLIDALNVVNDLRLRDELSEVMSATSQELIEFIIELYQTEMVFEGLDFFVLKRFELAENDLSIEAHRLLLPIPQEVIDNNPNAFQNPGY